MKKIVYRLKFVFEESHDANINRDDKLNSILSSMEDINTNEQIKAPDNGSIIEINGQDYEVLLKKYSFTNEGDLMFYTTIVVLVNYDINKNRQKNEHDLLLEKVKGMIRKDKWV